MAWIPRLDAIIEDSGTFTARVVWVNEAEGKKSSQDVPLIGVANLEAFNATLRANQSNKLDTSIELVKQLFGLIGQELDIVAVPVKPTPEDLAKRAWSQNYLQLLSAQRKIAAGVISDSDPDYLTLLAVVQKTYVSAYLGLN